MNVCSFPQNLQWVDWTATGTWFSGFVLLAATIIALWQLRANAKAEKVRLTIDQWDRFMNVALPTLGKMIVAEQSLGTLLAAEQELTASTSATRAKYQSLGNGPMTPAAVEALAEFNADSAKVYNAILAIALLYYNDALDQTLYMQNMDQLTLSAYILLSWQWRIAETQNLIDKTLIRRFAADAQRHYKARGGKNADMLAFDFSKED